MDPLIARNRAADKASAIRRRFLRESYGEGCMPKPITINLDPDMHEAVQSLPPTLTLTDLLLIQILREMQKLRPTEQPSPSESPAPPVAVATEAPATEPTT